MTNLTPYFKKTISAADPDEEWQRSAVVMSICAAGLVADDLLGLLITVGSGGGYEVNALAEVLDDVEC